MRKIITDQLITEAVESMFSVGEQEEDMGLFEDLLLEDKLCCSAISKQD